MASSQGVAQRKQRLLDAAIASLGMPLSQRIANDLQTGTPFLARYRTADDAELETLDYKTE
jgi:hypothetical protein